MNIFKLFASIELDEKGYLRSLKTAEAQTNKSSNKMGAAFTAFGRAAAVGTAAAATAITAVVGKGIMEFAALEKGMNEVFSLMPGMSEEAMQGMTDDVQAFAAEMGVVTDDVVPALYNSISAGVPADNVFAFLETANKLAVGGVTELNTAVDGLTSATNAYGTEILSAQEASDIMFTAVKAGKTTIDEIARSIGNIAPLAASVNVGFDELNAAVATLTSQGIGTSEAVTGMKAALSNILKPAGDMVDAMKGVVNQLVIADEIQGPLVDQFKATREAMYATQQQLMGLSEEDPEFDVLTKALEEMDKELNDLTKSLGPSIIESQGLAGTLELITSQANGGRDGLSALFGSVEGLNAVLALTSEQGGEAYLSTLEEMQDASGATDAAFEQMDQGIARTFERIQAVLQVFMTELGERFAPIVERVLVNALAFFETFSTNVLATIDKLTALYESGLFNMEGVQGERLDAMMGLWNAFRDSLTSVFEYLVTLWSKVLYPAWQEIQPFMQDLGDALVVILTESFNAIGAVFDLFAGLLSGDFASAWLAFKDLVSSVMNAISEVVTLVFSGLNSAFDGFFSGLQSAIASAWNSITGFVRDTASTLADAVRSAFAGAVSWVRGEINDAIDAVNSVITRINRALEIDIPDIEFTIPNPLPGDNDWEISFDTPDIDPPDIPSIPALAKGGLVESATLALIGEAGPEVVVPLDQFESLVMTGSFGAGESDLSSAASTFSSTVSVFAQYVDRLVGEGIALDLGAASRTAALR